MEKKDIRIKIIGPANIDTSMGPWEQGVIRLFDKNLFNVTIDNENPEYAIVSDWIYFIWDQFKDCMPELLNLDNNVIRIKVDGEAIVPDFNLLDYAFCYDNTLSFGDRAFRRPTVDTYGQYIHIDIDNTAQEKTPKELLAEKTEFANYIYSCYATANPKRGELFEKLSEYKFVHSPGAHFNNTKMDICRNANNWSQGSLDYKRKFKFSIAAENNDHRGCTTEKILTSMQANTIPIYWGNPDIAEEFNSKSFINCHEYNDFDEVLKRVKEIDQNDDLWCEIMEQPWRTKEQIEKANDESKKSKEWFNKIFLQDLQDARRRGSGTWNVWYEDTYKKRIDSSYENLYGSVKKPKSLKDLRRSIIHFKFKKDEKFIKLFGRYLYNSK